jgi:hypothetical protein
VLAHELAHDRPGLGCGIVLHGVLQRIFFYEFSDLFHETSPIVQWRLGSVMIALPLTFILVKG